MYVSEPPGLPKKKKKLKNQLDFHTSLKYFVLTPRAKLNIRVLVFSLFYLYKRQDGVRFEFHQTNNNAQTGAILHKNILLFFFPSSTRVTYNGTKISYVRIYHRGRMLIAL